MVVDDRHEAVGPDVGARELLLLVLVQTDRNRLRRVELVRDLRVQEPAADTRTDHEEQRRDPRPHGPPANGLLEVVVHRWGRRRKPGRAAGRRDHRRRTRREGSRRRTHDLRRGLLRHRRHRGPTQEALEIRIHLFGALVTVVRVLRERPRHDEVEIARNVRPLRRGRLWNRRQMLHRDLDRRVAVERERARD